MKRKNSLRKANWNYTEKASYHVTIVVKNRFQAFGLVTDEGVQLNALGKIAEKQWVSLLHSFNHIELGEYIIMPDHLHAILHIGGERASTKTASFKTGPIPGSLSHVVRVFKGYACKEIRTSCPQFEWQRGFYDQLIKNQKALSALEQYIRENPEKAKKKVEP